MGVRPATLVERGVYQSVLHATPTAVAFDLEHYDSHSYHDTVTNNTRITIGAGGWYRIYGTVQFAANATGFREINIRLNGTTYIDRDSPGLRSDNYWFGKVDTEYRLAGGDYLELVVYQNSGGALNVEASGINYPHFGVRYCAIY